MATRALDLATIFHALRTLEEEFLGLRRTWRLKGEVQEAIFQHFKAYGDLTALINGLKAKASKDWEALNAFLVSEGFDPMFDGPLEGIGVVSLLDKLVRWLEKGKTCSIHAGNQSFPGFEISRENFRLHAVPGGACPLVELVTQSDDRLFLVMVDQFLDDLEMFEFALGATMRKREVSNHFSGVMIPKVEFDLKPDIGFLRGAGTTDVKGDYWFISQAKQQFRFRMDEQGARVKVATGLGMIRGCVQEPRRPLIFDRPFLGWFTQQGINLPIAVFYAGYDSWKEPAGSLEAL